jgi:hypothetical protein
LCCWFFSFLFHYTYNNQDFLCNPNLTWFSSGVVLLFCTVSKKHNGKKQIVVKPKFGEKNPRVAIMFSHIKMSENTNSWTHTTTTTTTTYYYYSCWWDATFKAETRRKPRFPSDQVPST